MRNTIVICALFVLFAFTNATETLSKARLRGMTALERELKSESAFLSLKDTPFGKNLFSMMSLKFQATGRLDTINNLLDELQTNIHNQQTAEDQEYETTSNAYKTTIAQQEDIIATTTSNIDSWTTILSNKKDTLRQKRNQQAALIEERDSITEFLRQLEITRNDEVVAYKQRIEDQNAMVQGLDEVIQIFSIEVEGNANLDREAAQNILDLLHQIRESLQASIAEDTEAEVAAAAKYSAFVAEQNARLGEIATELKTLAVEISTLESEITTLEADIAKEEIRRADAIRLKADTEEALRKLTENYLANKEIRTQQISLIQQVKYRLNQNPTDVQQFLNNA